MRRLIFVSLLLTPMFLFGEDKLPNSRVIYYPDKRVSIVYGIEKSKKKDETEDEFYNRLISKIPSLRGLPFDTIQTKDIPADRSKRDTWKGEKGKGIEIEVSTGTIKLVPKPKDK